MTKQTETNDINHKWRYCGKTPSGGLAGGDDLYRCIYCHDHTENSDDRKDEICHAKLMRQLGDMIK